MSNPYSMTYGRIPDQLISRQMQSDIVCNAFMAEHPSQQVFMITGVRGTGKTVFMTEAGRRLAEDQRFIVAELNPEKDLLQGLAAKLSSDHALARIFQTAKINLSFFGLGLEVTGSVPITDIETALSKMLASLKNKGKRVLIEIDEVTNTQNMRTFSSAFQIFVRQDLPVYLLMTGLYENINALQNEKSLTFLYRAPKIELNALNIGAVADNYRKTFSLSQEDALAMAKETKGYSFAFQTLGFLTYENSGNFRMVRDQYKQYLEEYSYEKIWSELSANDRKILIAMTTCPGGRIQDVREQLEYTTNQFNPYRKRLIRKGVITGTERGYVHFALPLFEKFVEECASDDDWSDLTENPEHDEFVNEADFQGNTSKRDVIARKDSMTLAQLLENKYEEGRAEGIAQAVCRLFAKGRNVGEIMDLLDLEKDAVEAAIQKGNKPY
ncbi:MAG: ATP-binding protein [Bulleidia sp.]|nr:ATP-binding protein [Bulleidia sp.]